MLRRTLQDAFRTGKRTFHHIYTHATKWAGDIDQTMKMGKRIFAALHPALDQLGAGNTSKALVQGFGAYDRGRDEVIGGYNNVQSHLSRLRRAVPELEL